MADESGIIMNSEQFHNRLSSFVTQWKADQRAGDAIFGGVGSIVIPVGKATDSVYTKTAAFQMWLFGYEFPSVIMVLTPDAFHIVATKKKAKHLTKLQGGKVPVEIHTRGKDVTENEGQFKQLVELTKKCGVSVFQEDEHIIRLTRLKKKVGMLTKEVTESALPEEWKQYWEKHRGDSEEVNVAVAISVAALSVKDEIELRSIRDASRASAKALGNYFVDQMSSILDEEKKITHQALSDKVNDIIENDKFWAKEKVSNNFDVVNLDWAFPPVVQSGGSYDLKFNSEPDKQNLHGGVVVAALGMRYNTYSSFIARTYLIDPTKVQEANYKLLLSVHEAVIQALKDGSAAKDAYGKASALIKSKKPEVEQNFVKSVGFSIGIETKDSTLVLNAKSTRTLKDGMTFVILTGLSDLTNPDASDKRGKTYSLALADTVRVQGGQEAAVFTKDVSSRLDDVSFFFKDEPEPSPKKVVLRDARIGGVAQQNIQSTRLRKERQANHDAEKEAKLREHQRELHDKLQKQGLQKYTKANGALNGHDEKRFKLFESYKRNDQFPTKTRDLSICLDSRTSTLILPIMGRPVPFHINTIKNASSTSEGDFTSLRINFLSPGQGVGRKDDLPFEDPNAQFVRSLTYRSTDERRMESLSQQITEMKKDATRREQEKKQMEDVVEQDKLVFDRRGQKLDMIFIRPTLDTKRIPGVLEIHQNGLRYVHGSSQTGQKVDVLFNNIKHVFFQPTKGEMIVLIHFHLHNPIMIGKRKTKDVQVFREAIDMQFDETGTRKRKHRYGDEDEFEQEQEEKRRRTALDKEFKAFAKKIEDAADSFQVDVPNRNLGFNGVPFRTNVVMQPSADALVQLSEPPFTVITLNEVEIVHLERVTFGLKNFDLVIVYKDISRPVQHINTIPVESLDAVKDWLDSMEIPFYTGNLNLQWNTIMKTVQADPHDFFKAGGWTFLSSDSDDEDGGDESEEESAFEMDASDFGSEASSENESDFDENASQEAEDDDLTDVSEAPSWDELEANAVKKDRARGLNDEDEKKKAGQKRKR